jgi:hypothetical protein
MPFTRKSAHRYADFHVICKLIDIYTSIAT